jgi:aconitase A
MTSSMNSFDTKSSLDVSGRSLTFFSLQGEGLAKFGVERLPFSIKVLLENLLRNEDGIKVTAPPRLTEKPPATRHVKSPSPRLAFSCRT